MSDEQIIQQCQKLGISRPDAERVAEELYNYAVPDWSEWSWTEINQCLREVHYCITHPEENPCGF